ncbi:hypothetical protein [Alkalicoccobacillus plakortidis]|uniref:Uncharacterized protein n=1 Tax=Alkalicoccobacillus plakortidis TaxID=444060 RepID=A0ABT0XPH7_9BACI|nr:hypothetical protein [Alkalicoccobacillus plakortidis]MCM2677766.1 hypothetical protein [Alkalicoccobacillus plakortidis]
MTYIIQQTNTQYEVTLQKVFNYLSQHEQIKGYSPSITEISKHIGDTEEMILESLEFGQNDPLPLKLLH